MRIQKNEYLKDDWKIIKNKWMAKNNNELLLEKKNELVPNKIDIYWFNEEVQQVKKILKKSKLNELLHYTTYQIEQTETLETDGRMEN